MGPAGERGVLSGMRGGETLRASPPYWQTLEMNEDAIRGFIEAG